MSPMCDARWPITDNRYPISDIRYPISDIRYPMAEKPKKRQPREADAFSTVVIDLSVIGYRSSAIGHRPIDLAAALRNHPHVGHGHAARTAAAALTLTGAGRAGRAGGRAGAGC